MKDLFHNTIGQKFNIYDIHKSCFLAQNYNTLIKNLKEQSDPDTSLIKQLFSQTYEISLEEQESISYDSTTIYFNPTDFPFVQNKKQYACELNLSLQI